VLDPCGHESHVGYLTCTVVSSRMLKTSAGGVLASLRGSTYRNVRLISSLAAALLEAIFVHPEVVERRSRRQHSSDLFGNNQVFQ
ncbi:MAG: hypothetical protein KF751_15760, partial [Nitrospira sp.]|nr:hypothetical protein [Nitrospira sp.]